jgi:hypothetical protein
MRTWCFNFKAHLAPMVERGSKTQTVRAMRVDGRMPVAGDVVKLYTGLRTKQTRLLRPMTQITLVEYIELRPNEDGRGVGEVWLDHRLLDANEACEFAVRDGFRDGPSPTAEMFDFFDVGGSLDKLFCGFVVHWRAL